MQLPNLTPDQIQERCTAQSFTRGTEYFHAGAIGNPILHGYTLSATCHGTYPYRVSVELMPTGIATTHCSCPYDGDGDCKHIVALLLTYVHTPDLIDSIDSLIAMLAEKPKANLLRIISELLRRTPDLASVARVYADTSDDTEAAPTTLEVYRERIDSIFGPGFLEQQQLHNVLVQLEGLVQHAKSLSQLGETELALSILHALIHQSILRYSDTLQKQELPRFVKKCTAAFAQVVIDTQKSPLIGFGIETVPIMVNLKNKRTFYPTAVGAVSNRTLLEHCQMLLALSFDAPPVFTRSLTDLLQQCCEIQESADLQATIEQRLNESPDRKSHVQLLAAFYFQTGRTADCLRLARREAENYLLIHTLFRLQQDAAAWRTLETHRLSADEHWCLLESPIAMRIPEFTNKLLLCVRCYDPDTAIALYHRLIEKTVRSRKREDYEKVRGYLIDLHTLYKHSDQESEWTLYLTHFRKRHTRKRLLLQIIDTHPTP